MTDKTWKAAERHIAKCFRSLWPSARRNPLSGSVDHQTHADVAGVPVYVEVRHRARLPFMADYLDAQGHARQEGKPLVLVMHRKGSHHYFAVLELDQLIAWEDVLHDG